MNPPFNNTCNLGNWFQSPNIRARPGVCFQPGPGPGIYIFAGAGAGAGVEFFLIAGAGAGAGGHIFAGAGAGAGGENLARYVGGREYTLK